MAVALAMAGNYGHTVHPFFMPRNGGRSSSYLRMGKADIESAFDQNEGRRKRQRTASPDPKPTPPTDSTTDAWAEQLNDAAYGPLVAPDGGGHCTMDDGNPIRQGHANEAEKSASDGTSPAPNNDDDTLTRESVGAVTKENEMVPGKTAEMQPAATPPKRMLRVRPDGKLGSPKVNTPAADTRPRRTRRSTKAEPGKKSLVATVKFGTTDDSRLTIGRKIDGILLGMAKHPSPFQKQPAKQKEQLKPTHPFFVAGSARFSRPENALSSKNEDVTKSGSQDPQQQRKADSPRQARVTSKPADVADRPVGGIAFGSTTFGSNHARISRFPGANEPIWPPVEMLHVGRPSESPETPLSQPGVETIAEMHRKMKTVQIQISKEDDVMKPCIDLVQAYHSDRRISQKVYSRDWREYRRPLRRLLTGRELQRAVRQWLVSGPSLISSEDHEVDELSISHQQPAHKALRNAYESIATSVTAFDKFECEPQDWVHKYAPKAAEEVLQHSHEVILLRDWLRGLTVRAVQGQGTDKSRAREPSVVSRRRVKRKKRKRVEGLDDFVVSSEDEASQMDEITDPEDIESSRSLLKRSVIRAGDVNRDLGGCERSSNAVVISGPHGCGKTAAVYAVAQELGFEVFEISSRSRRGGKDIMDKVGDMTRNHLVEHGQRDNLDAAVAEEAQDQEDFNDKLKEDIATGRQGTMSSFFKSKVAVKEKQPKMMKSSPRKKTSKSDDPPDKKKQGHKQSLILLEEVDVLFEEDKAFWATVLDLISQSKRPIVMTCTDESLLPMNDLVLYAIFRFGATAEQLAIDYLLLIACNEGHLLPRNAVAALYESKGFDLRASIAELNFFCQMAIGDNKGGLEWMLITSSRNRREDEGSELLRVVSDGAYQYGMGWLSGEPSTPPSDQSIALEVELLSEAWNGWGIDVGAFEEYLATQSPSSTQEVSRQDSLKALQCCEMAYEAFSVADTFSASVSRNPNHAILDCTNPELTEKARTSYVEGAALLQADPVVDQTGLANSLALTLRTCSRRILTQASKGPGSQHFDEQSILRVIPKALRERQSEKAFSKSHVSPAFDPISRSQKAVLGIPRGPQISTFDGPISIIAEDLAPYVRSIVSYDLRLEEQRRQLSSLLSQPGKGGKKTRTTRASRAALEGGSKAHTRRERWFPNSTNFDLVLQSGGKNWQDVLLQRTTAETLAEGAVAHGSRRSSLGNIPESDA